VASGQLDPLGARASGHDIVPLPPKQLFEQGQIGRFVVDDQKF